MAVLRYNPVFKQWVLLGETLPKEVTVRAGHELDRATRIHPQFQVVTHPQSPFLLDVPEKRSRDETLLYDEEPPIGEYELVRYLGDAGAPKQWQSREWEGWLRTVAARIALLHRNPHLHHVSISLDSSLLHTTGSDALRVGDIIATSHPVAGSVTGISEDLIQKLIARERAFVLYTTSIGSWYAPSAPLHRRECWFLPNEPHRHIDALPDKQIGRLAETIARVVEAWGEEFSRAHYTLVLHGAMVSRHQGESWWLQLYETPPAGDLPMQIAPLPERFAHLLHHTIPAAHGHK